MKTWRLTTYAIFSILTVCSLIIQPISPALARPARLPYSAPTESTALATAGEVLTSAEPRDLLHASVAVTHTLYLPLVMRNYTSPIVIANIQPGVGGQVEASDGKVQISFAPQAVTQTVSIAYTPLSAPSGLPAGQRLVGGSFQWTANTTDGRPLADFLPEVTTHTISGLTEYVVTNTVFLTITYTDADVAGLTEHHLTLYTRSGNQEWHALPTLVDTAANVATAPLSHFSDFALLGMSAVPTQTWVVLDPDHGGADPGGTVTSPAAYALEEKVVNLDAALKVKSWLQQCGVNVLMTREDDSSLSAQWRADWINATAPDFAVTVGFNIATHNMDYFVGGPMGLADFSKPVDQPFAQTLVTAISDTTTLPPDRGVHDAATWRGGLYVPTHVPNTTYAQIEAAFIDSYHDRDNVIDPKLEYIAGGIYNGLIAQAQLTTCVPFSGTVVDTRLQRTLGVNQWTRYSGQGVNPVTGNQFQWARDLFVPGTGLNVDLVRYYNSQSDEVGLFGRGWSSLYDMRVTALGSDTLQVKYADGHKANFTLTNGVYQPEAGVYETLAVESGGYTLTTADQLRFAFDTDGKLLRVADEIENALQLQYAGGQLAQIQDTTGRTFAVDTNANGQIAHVTDPSGRAVTYTYGLVSLARTQYLQNLRGPLATTAGTDLLSMTDARDGSTNYEYDPAGGYLDRITDPEGMTYLDNVYTPDGRVAQQKNGKQDQGKWDYDLANMRAVFTDNEGNKTTYVFDGKYRVAQEIDALGQITKYEYDDRDNITAKTDKRGNTWRYTYDERGNMLTSSDPLDAWSLYASDVTTWTYDDKNHVTSMTDALGNQWLYAYDDKGNPIKVTEPNGAATTAQYDGKGQMIELVDGEGRLTKFDYDSHGNRIKTWDAAGGWTASTFDAAGHELTRTECLNPLACTQTRTTTNEYDGNGNVIKTIDPMGQITTSEYDGNNLLKKKTDRRGGVWEWQYDENLNPIWAKDPLNRITEYTYNKMDRRLTAKDPLARLTTFKYDVLYRLTEVKNPKDDVYTYAYDPNGNLLTLTDPLQQSTAFTYDATNRRKFIHDALGGTTEYCYDPLDRIIRAFDPRRAETNFDYDTVGNMVKVIDPLGNRIVLGYDRVHNRTTLTEGIPSDGVEADGRTSRVKFDPLNRPITQTDPLGRITTTAYNGVGNAVSMTDPLGYVANSEYNLNGWVTRQIDPLGGETHYQYDAEGLTTVISDALHHAARYEYDLAGQLRTATDPLNAATTYDYDLAGNQIRVMNALGSTTVYTYDQLNLLTEERDPLGHLTGYQYDPLRRLTVRTDANGKATDYGYNALGWLTSVTDALSQTTRYQYDPVGNRTAIVDANGITTTFEYNVLNQLMREINPLGKVWNYSYDASGNMIRRVDGQWQATYYDYDKASQLIATRYGVGAGQNVSVTFEYDPNGNELAMHDWNGDWFYTYDQLNRRTTATDYVSRTLTWAYDAVGNRTGMTYPDSRAITMTYDAGDRLDTLHDAQGRAISWNYDALGYITAQANPNSTHTDYTYDAASRLIALSNQGPSAVVIAAYNFTLDAVGNRTQVVEQNNAATLTRDYGYDDLYRLTSARTNTGQDMAYVYDPVGNRQSKAGTPEPTTVTATAPISLTYDYNVLNSMLRAGTTQFAYDDNGNRIRKTEPLTATDYISIAADLNLTGTLVSTYVYDYENRLTAVTEAVSTTDSLSVTMQARYAYDGYGRRVQKWVATYSLTETVTITTPAEITQTIPLTTSLLRREYVFDGLEPVAEYDYVAEYGAAAETITPTLVSQYTYGNGRMVLLERTAITSTQSYWYHYDGLGSVVALTDESGAEACRTKYDEYGNLLQSCLELNRYSYTGQEYDEETGLIHFFARYYDPATGAWVSQDSYRGSIKDPITIQRYVFVLQNPVNNRDKYGYFLESFFKSLTEPDTLASIGVGLLAAAITIAVLPAAATVAGAIAIGAAAVAVGTAATTITYDLLNGESDPGKIAEHVVKNVVVNEVVAGATAIGTAVAGPVGGAVVLGGSVCLLNLVSNRPCEEDMGTTFLVAALSSRMFKSIEANKQSKLKLSTTSDENVSIKNGEFAKSDVKLSADGFPKFDSLFDAKISESMYKKSDYLQFKEATNQLNKAIQVDPNLKSQFTPEQIQQIENGIKPDGYTWHHSETPGKLQLVDQSIHAKTGHTGGRSIWGGGSEYR